MSTLIFIHIPKCAGSTLNRVIQRQYPIGSLFRIDSRAYMESVQKLAALPHEERRKIKVLAGHMSYGLHEYLPGEFQYMTMLRDPVDRLISHYYFVRRKTNHPLHEELTRRDLSLEEYLEDDLNIEMVNNQTRHLSGISDPKVDLVGEVGDQALIDAARNLQDNVAAVGLTERFDESVLLYQHLFGWSVPVYERTNVSRGRPRGREVPERAKEIAAERNHLDVALYALAEEKFEEQLVRTGIGPRELLRFQKKNRAYGMRKRAAKTILDFGRKWSAFV